MTSTIFEKIEDEKIKEMEVISNTRIKEAIAKEQEKEIKADEKKQMIRT